MLHGRRVFATRAFALLFHCLAAWSRRPVQALSRCRQNLPLDLKAVRSVREPPYDGEWQDYPFPPDPHAIDSTHSIFIACILHIMSNVTKSMGKAMIMFSEFIKQLTNVCRMLSKKEYRSQLMQTCFDRYPHSLNKSKFKGFSCHVHEDRWGTPAIVISLVCLV